jgi:hypothetical protein
MLSGKVHLLHWHAVLVRRIALRLTAKLLVALNRAHIRHFDDNGLAKGTGIVRRVRVLVSCQSKAPSARITGTESWARPECKLADRSGESGGSLSTC